MLNLTMPECFVPESEIRGAPNRVEWDVPNYRGYDWKPIEWSQIIRNGVGDIIFTNPQCKAMVQMLREALGKPLFSVYFLDARNNYPDQVALGLPEGITLDAEELAAVSMAAWLNATQFPGIKRTDSPMLPDDMNEYTAHPDTPVALDAVFYDMDDANRMASLLSTLYCVRPKVIRNGSRWGVVVHDKRFLNSIRVIELASIHNLLVKYTIEPKSDASGKDIPFTERIEEQAAFEARIEDGINAILSSLSDIATPGKAKVPARSKTSASAVDAVAEPPAGQDAHSRSAKPASKKSSPKKSA